MKVQKLGASNFKLMLQYILCRCMLFKYKRWRLDLNWVLIKRHVFTLGSKVLEMDHEGLEIVNRKTLVYISKVSIIDKRI